MHNDTSSVFADILSSGYPLRFLIYNGDVDMACQFLGDQWFIEKLAKDQNMVVTRPHGPWNYTQGQYLPRVGGYSKQFTFTHPTKKTQVTFDQLTVKGAGHFVPQDRPGPSLQMIYNFVNKFDFNRNLTLDYTRKPLLPAYQPAPVTVSRRKADHIFALPGATWNFNFNQHSGYLQATPGNKLFYWFVESQSGNEGDPIVLWLQGGPGCASTGGLFGEIGPFFVNPDGETLFENVYSWNKAAHILVIDSPRSVGFSYQDQNVNNDTTWDDDKTALDTYTALEDFFAAYTPHRNSELYITGESYGGVYVPTLTRLLIQKIQAGQSNIKLRGMGIGNGMISAVNDVRTLPDFLYFHGIYDKPYVFFRKTHLPHISLSDNGKSSVPAAQLPKTLHTIASTITTSPLTLELMSSPSRSQETRPSKTVPILLRTCPSTEIGRLSTTSTTCIKTATPCQRDKRPHSLTRRFPDSLWSTDSRPLSHKPLSRFEEWSLQNWQ